jgi:hypothetical protein
MKISDLLCQYLYQTRELVLEGFGVFRLDPSVNPTEAKEQEQVYQGITFENDPKLKTPAPFVDFLILHSGKMKPLAISDLEAFLTTGKELLNIGKPLILNGIGTLTRIRNQYLEFTPGPFIPIRLEPLEHPFRERVATSEEELFRSEDVPGGVNTSRNRRTLLIVAVVLLVLLGGWGVYHFLIQKKSSAADTQIQPAEAPTAQKDTTAGAVSSTEAGPAAKPDSIPASGTGPVTFRILVRTYEDQASAQRRFDSLKTWGHNVAMVKEDSTHYSIIMPFSVPLSDTTAVKDSLTDFVGRKVTVLLGAK